MAHADPAIRLAYRFNPGQRLVYRVTVSGHVSVETPEGVAVNPVRIEMELWQTVSRLEEDRAFIQVLVRSARAFSGSESTPLPEEGQRMSFIMKENGETTYEDGASPFQGSEFAQMAFPAHPLRIGDSWEQSPAGGKPGQGRGKTRYTFLRQATSGIHACSVFQADMNLEPASTAGGGEAHGGGSSGEVWFSETLGQVIHTTAKSQFSFTIPIPQTYALAKTTTALTTEMKLIAASEGKTE
ncbi:MAG TPA: hypothetical protein PKO06_04445 [Candidatus Ozemobacteraceae bacterium]|nr:hypothetical protein [Candidatus Ozemobacteraceae bacterium]